MTDAHWPGRVRAAFADDFPEAASVDDGFGPVSVDVDHRVVQAVGVVLAIKTGHQLAAA